MIGANERDEFVEVVGAAMAFYNKPLDKATAAIWFKALREYGMAEIAAAFDQYMTVGKYAPKPVDILEIVAEQRQHSAAVRGHVEQPYTPCPPDIYAAWSWFFSVAHADMDLTGGLVKRPAQKVDEETANNYLLIVNREARRLDLPDAIPGEYKLREVWA